MILFNLLLRLFPVAFREEFGGEMRRLFVEQRCSSRGASARARFWIRTIGGMTSAAWRERRDGRLRLSARLPVVETLITDLRLAFRMMLARPLFTATVVIAISLGVGAVSTIFSGLNALVLRPLPGVTDGDRLVLVDRRAPDYSEGVSASVRFYQHLREHSRSLSGVAVWSRVAITVVVGQDAHSLSANIVSDNYFDVLGVRAVAGRFFDTQTAAEPTIVLSHGTWTSRFQADPTVVGRSIAVNGRPYRIIGVASPAFRGVFTPLKVDAWLPLSTQPHVHPQRDLADQPWLWAFGRMKDGFDAAQVRSELSTLTAAWSASGGDPYVRYTSMRLTPLTGLPDDARQALLGFGAVLLGAAALVLIIAAANVSTLLAMRATARRREMGIRTALGAGRGRLVRQLLTETLMLFVLGGLGGTFIAVLGTSALERLPIPSDQGLSLELSPDVRVLLFSIGISLVVGLVFGIVPALRSAGRNPVTLLRAASAGGGRRTWTSNALIVAQMTCSLVLLTTAGLFVRAVVAGASIDPGFDARHVAILSLNTQSFGYDAVEGQAFHRTLRQRVERAPGVEAVTFADFVPLTLADAATTVLVDGAGGERRLRVGVGSVDRGYFDTLGIRLLAGREFAATDTARSQAVAVVNETFTHRAWPETSPASAIGRTIRSGDLRVTIVGVARDSKYTTPGEDPKSFVYWALSQNWRAGQTMFVRVNGDPAGAARLIEEAVSSIDPRLPRIESTTLTREAQTSLLPQRVAAMVTGVLGVAGLLLAAIGLYGLVSYGVTLRLKEIGVRLALGAARGDVVRMVLVQGLRLTAVGAVLGFIVSIFAGRFVQSYLLNVSAMDMVAFAGALAILVAIGVLAALIPARRAAAADPLIALRTD